MGKYDILKWYIWYSGGDPPQKKTSMPINNLGGALVEVLCPTLWGASCHLWSEQVQRSGRQLCADFLVPTKNRGLIWLQMDPYGCIIAALFWARETYECGGTCFVLGVCCQHVCAHVLSSLCSWSEGFILLWAQRRQGTIWDMWKKCFAQVGTFAI